MDKRAHPEPVASCDTANGCARKRPRAASTDVGAPTGDAAGVVRPASDGTRLGHTAARLLPVEVWVYVLERPVIGPRDLVMCAMSGTLLYEAAAFLIKQLDDRILATESARLACDYMGACTDLNNAILHDDPAAIRAIRRMGLVRLDEPLPTTEVMGVSVSPVTIVVDVCKDNTMSAFDQINGVHLADVALHRFIRRQRHIYSQYYREASFTPLARAVDAGSRRALRALVAAGARPSPSIEALLAYALGRVNAGRVAVIDTLMTTCHADPQQERMPFTQFEVRHVDVCGIIEDLLRAFQRTRPSMHPLDVSPLYVLRARSTDETGTRIPEQLVRMLVQAGYSPDEPTSGVPQDCSVTAAHKFGLCKWPTTPPMTREEAARNRSIAIAFTERRSIEIDPHNMRPEGRMFARLYGGIAPEPDAPSP